ncbi:hypothetical protein [Rhodopirellula halodulae]|uniref:hypothetical protein n=1 Tax=Rhodopirellula halodulae TaxID=2894198 RepID=UPI001E3CDD20|nr:hypothetical protein [Rhodopirellula sp. JC737]MCC9658188.1 hypothetical protein [Rhodopirellula sp. JC737]
MRPRLKFITIGLTLFMTVVSAILPTSVWACLWDRDTLAMERRFYPHAHEMIAGFFPKHSDAYYEWRIDDRLAVPEESRSPSDYDDLAVAYDKLGQHDEAVAVMEKKLERFPKEGRYQSEANLGTFLIHAGRYAEGLVHIQRAIEINPEAHFGREIYQQLLVEYLIQQEYEPEDLPIAALDARPTGFASFIMQQRSLSGDEAEEELHRAAVGVMGMMRFGHHDSPVLLEALGDLLAGGDPDGMHDSKMLSARAYLQAASRVQDETIASKYREKAEATLFGQMSVELPNIEESLRAETRLASDLHQQVAMDEERWIRANIDVDEQFARKYLEGRTYQLPIDEPVVIRSVTRIGVSRILVLGVIGLAVVGLVGFVWRRIRRGNRIAAH